MSATDPAGTDLATAGIAGLAGLIESGRASPLEVMQATLERIDRLNDNLNAFISLYPDMALQAARTAEAEIQAGNYRGPLHGVPIGVKDLFLVEGMSRTCGSQILHEAPSEVDASCIANLKEAGAIVVGLLNLNEFAYGPTGINPHVGTARNPWNAERACGGSSAGAGCAVAASLVPAAMGTDTGGSVRIPAATCGVVGLKQSYGLVSRHGIYPLAESFDHAGPLTRTVTDAAIMLQALAGEDTNDETTRGVIVDNYSASLGEDIRGKRIGVPTDFFFDDLHPDTADRVQAAIKQLEALGAEVREIFLPDMKAAVHAWNTMALCEAYVVHEGHVRDHAGKMGPEVESRVLLGKEISARDYIAARDHQTRVRQAMAEVMREVDAIAAPTTPIPAVEIETGCTTVDGKIVDGIPIIGRFTRLAVFSGQPAISLPCGFTADGLPVGLQLIGSRFDEAALLSIADAYERATAWHLERPPGFD
jgi:aspartyl-tRNA(Asn)/glutamyl-tRNA(Gln) amidotransferase subunit A